MNQRLQYLTAYLCGAVSTGVLASIVQTQVSLSELAAIGVPISTSARAMTTIEDLLRFGPVMAAIAAAALLPAVVLSVFASRNPKWRLAISAVASALSLWILFWLMRFVIPMPAIAGTRIDIGHVLMALTGLIGGAVFAAMTSAAKTARSRSGSIHPYAAPGLMLAVPIGLFFAMAPRSDAPAEEVDPSSYQVQTIASGLNRPWSLAFLPDGRMLVTEMGGRLVSIGTDGSSRPISLDGLPPIFSQNGVIGLMEVALDPRFPENGWIYMTMGHGEATASGTRLVRARLLEDRIDDVRVLFSSTPKPRAGNNGGRIAFLGDETLVLTLGDGSARREEAQNVSNHLGALIRVDRDGKAPDDNPFLGRPDAAPEIYSFGHRNVQGIAFDTSSNELLISEHGARGGDEINRVLPGRNYGWPVVTGGIDYPFARVSPFTSLEGYEPAILEWTPSIAPAGLAVYQGQMFPEWEGDLLVPALKERSIRRVIRNEGRIVGQQRLLSHVGERMRDVRVAPDGSIYVLTDGIDGKLLRIVPVSSAS